MIKNDRWITAQSVASRPMIEPFHPELIREVDEPNSLGQSLKVISFGLSSFGYDIRLSPKSFFVFNHIPGTVVDPKRFNPDNLTEVKLQEDEMGQFFVLPAHSYGLGVALEKLRIPENISVLCIGKSSYARIGIIANLTPAEAGWRGHLTLEFSNSSDADCRIYANEGIVQLLFFEGDECDVSYDDRQGKYQDQRHEVTTVRL